MAIADYSVWVRDGEGRTCCLHINGACIEELVAAGASLDIATEEIESIAFGNAIARNEIGSDAYSITP